MDSKHDNTIKVIDFGKATTTEFPITYCLSPFSRVLYAKVHCFVEKELREIPNTITTFQSDVFSVGYLLLLIADDCNIDNEDSCLLQRVGLDCNKPRAYRPDLSLVLDDLVDHRCET